MTRILLTGANGFVGRQIAKALLAAGVQLRCTIRPGQQTLVGAEQVVTSDLFCEDEAFWHSALNGVDGIVHAAWFAVPGQYLQSPINLACVIGTLRMAMIAAERGVKRFVGIGSCFEYDLTHGFLSTETPLKPASAYAQCKAACFGTLSSVLPAMGVSFSWCRLFYLYGEGEHPARLVPYLHRTLAAGEPALLSSGRQIRDFLDVAEAGRQIASVALSNREGPLNICSGRAVTVAELATRIAEGYGRVDLLRFGARPDNLIDPPCVIGQPSLT